MQRIAKQQRASQRIEGGTQAMVASLASAIERANPGLLGALPQWVVRQLPSLNAPRACRRVICMLLVHVLSCIKVLAMPAELTSGC